MVQYSGLLAMAWMSFGMVLAVRPKLHVRWFGGLDKMYRLHKWLGISALVMSILHWSSSNAPKWASALGLLASGPHGARAVLANPIARWLTSYRGVAESIGEWTFYAATLLIVVALVKWIPYRLFYKTHRLLAAAYLALVFHTVVLTKFDYWLSPVGLLLVPLLACGTWAAVIVLLRRVAAGRLVRGKIASLQYYPGVRSLEVAIDVPKGWAGHKPGQFAFVTSNKTEGAHAYTIASAWNDGEKRIAFIVKELGDHTESLREKLRVGREVKIEGPYGCFTFEDACPDQIWVGGGIGITPFVARLKYLAGRTPRSAQIIHLFHPTADYDAEALARLAADAEAGGAHLHVLVDKRDGRLDGERIRAAVPAWRESSIWFCGPIGLGQGLRADFAAAGMSLDRQFHQELFAIR
jgi:predicted ferric reductase